MKTFLTPFLNKFKSQAKKQKGVGRLYRINLDIAPREAGYDYRYEPIYSEKYYWSIPDSMER